MRAANRHVCVLVAVVLANSAWHVSYVLNVTTVTYVAWGALSLSSDEVRLDPGGSEELTITLAAPMGCNSGRVIAYDLVTGCEYDTFLISSSGKQSW